MMMGGLLQSVSFVFGFWPVGPLLYALRQMYIRSEDVIYKLEQEL